MDEGSRLPGEIEFAMASEPVPSLASGETLDGRYRIVRALGHGGMGVAFLAVDERLTFDHQSDPKHVVVKILINTLPWEDWRQTAFENEKRALVRLQHDPGSIGVIDAGVHSDGKRFLVMEYCDGETLEAFFATRISRDRLVNILLQAARSLDHAHRCGVLHCDIKPSNIMVQRLPNGEDFVRIIDFGVATLRNPSDPATELALPVGTIEYMAPEQFLGRPVVSSDVYGLGVVAYQLLTGHLPYPLPPAARSASLILELQKKGPKRPSVANPSLPVPVDQVILRALAFRPDDRYDTVTAFALDLARAFASAAPCPLPDPIPEGFGSSGSAAMTRLVSSITLLVDAILVAIRDHDNERAGRLLEEAAAMANPENAEHVGLLARCRGTLRYHDSDTSGALADLNKALAYLGPNHRQTGYLVGLLGDIWADRGNFGTARDLFHKAMEIGQRAGDDGAVAQAHGQMGRLCLRWGRLDDAAHHFREDMTLARKIGDQKAVCQMYNHLGQVELERRSASKAGAFLDEAIGLSRDGGWTALLGFSLKDRALLRLFENRTADARRDAESARELFEKLGFTEGRAHALLVLGIADRIERSWRDSEERLLEAYTFFHSSGELWIAARAELERARLMMARGTERLLVCEALKEALGLAEASFHEAILREIETEWHTFAPLEFTEHLLRRVRGAGASPDCSSLQQGTTEDASILFADFVSFKDAAHGEDPDWHLRAVNELLGEMGGLLARHSVHIISHLGRGFMAVARGRAHAARAVAAAVEMHKRLDEINIPRQVLGLTKLDLRIAVNTGPVVLGNVGTYWKLDFTATGPAVEMASLLLAKALPGGPCISEETHTRVEKLFRMSKDSPSTVHLEGIGAMSVWHVVAAQEDVGASAAVVKRR